MIQFTTPVSANSLYMAFNNLIIRYYSTTSTTPQYSEITGLTIGLVNTPITLYPAPNGTFFFNFKPYVAALINRHNFEDTVGATTLCTARATRKPGTPKATLPV